MSDPGSDNNKESDFQRMKERLQQLAEERRKLSEVTKATSPAANGTPSHESSTSRPQLSWSQKEEIDSRSVFVSNLDTVITTEDIQDHFSACGSIERVTRLTNSFAVPKPFAYIEFADKAQAEAALTLDGSIIKDNGRQIKVAPKRTNIPYLSRGRRRARSFRGRGRRGF
ncbi:hypothetical protein P9112_005759 [Eukaryota sp. TZLM1-RC]